MMRIYGPVFILHDELLDFTKSAAELERPRNTWDECVNYVIGELNSLIESPYMKSNWTSSTEKGLATKGACQAIISRLTLYSARDLFNGNTMYASVKNPDGTNLFPQNYDAAKWKRQQMQHTRSLMAIFTNYITLMMMIRMIIIMA